MQNKRGNVWLGVANLVVNELGQWLLVKKTYSGLKGLWSLPAGFVKAGETIEMAAQREVLEETGITCNVHALIGFRSGVIRAEISDNMAILVSTVVGDHTNSSRQEREVEEIAWMSPEEIATHPLSSSMLREMAKNRADSTELPVMDGPNPGEQFGYTAYQLYFNNR